MTVSPKSEALKDFKETLRRNPHYKGAGGFKMATLRTIEEILDVAAHNERIANG